jgi:hypothetical protein
MPTAAVPSQNVSYKVLGITDVLVSNPVLFLKVAGVTYANGYKVYYGSSSFRNFFPVYNEQSGEIRLYCYALTYGTTLPSITLSNIEVHIAN